MQPQPKLSEPARLKTEGFLEASYHTSKKAHPPRAETSAALTGVAWSLRRRLRAPPSGYDVAAGRSNVGPHPTSGSWRPSHQVFQAMRNRSTLTGNFGKTERNQVATEANPANKNRPPILSLAARRQGIARCAALHLDCARSAGAVSIGLYWKAHWLPLYRAMCDQPFSGNLRRVWAICLLIFSNSSGSTERPSARSMR